MPRIVEALEAKGFRLRLPLTKGEVELVEKLGTIIRQGPKTKKSNDLKYDIFCWVILAVTIVAWVGFAKSKRKGVVLGMLIGCLLVIFPVNFSLMYFFYVCIPYGIFTEYILFIYLFSMEFSLMYSVWNFH